MQQYTTLISVNQLATLMASNDAPNPLIIFDCRFSLADTTLGRHQYETGHIPTAIYVHLDHDLAGDITSHSGRHPLPKVEHFIRRVRAWGINNHTQIVVYDDAGGAIATRLWWMMKWLGHTRVALLDGGGVAWQHGGQPMSAHSETAIKTDRQSNWQGHQQDQSTASEKFVAKLNENRSIEIDELTELLKSKQIQLYDARAALRFAGKHEPIDTVAGHIPGAINLPFEQNLDEHGFFLSADALKRRFAAVFESLSSDNGGDLQIAHMCGSGVTACHNMLAMEIAEMEPTRLYVGSWSQWIRDPNRAVASL